MLILLLVIVTSLIILHTEASAEDTDSSLSIPFGLSWRFGSVYLSQHLSKDLYLFAIEKDGANYIVLMKIEPLVPPRYEIIRNISIPSRVSAVAVDSLLDPLSVAVGFANKVLIMDLRQNTVVYFAVMGNVHKIYPYGSRAYIVLTDEGVFAIRSYKDKWFEARPVIGSLLEEKREGIRINDIIPVLTPINNSLEYTYLLVAKEEIAPADTVQVPIEVLWTNGSLVNSGSLYLVVSRTLVSKSSITNGSTIIAVPKSQPKLTFYAKISERCYGPISVSSEQLISQNISTPIFIDPNTTVPCHLLAMFSKQNYLAILSPEGNLALKEYPLQSTTTSILGNINVLSAYMDDDRIYLWISSFGSKIFTTENFVATLVFDKKDFSPITQLWLLTNISIPCSFKQDILRYSSLGVVSLSDLFITICFLID
jgi:hypothetical protein